jgi:hypothetical protein
MTSRRATRRRSGALVRPGRPSRRLPELAAREELARPEAELLGADSVPVLQGAIRFVTDLLHQGGADRVGAAEQLSDLQRRLLDRPYEPDLAGWGWPQYHHCRQVEVPARLRRGFTVGAGRVGECYETALGYVLDHADQPVTLACGAVWELGLPWPHCWVEFDVQDAVMDPATGHFYDRGDFYRVLEPSAVVLYPPAEAARLLEDRGLALAPMWARMDELATSCLEASRRPPRAWAGGWPGCWPPMKRSPPPTGGMRA